MDFLTGLEPSRCFLELKEIQEKKVAIDDELIRIKHETVHSYMEMAEVSDYLSAADLKRHKELQDKVLKWLFNRGFIAMAEFTLPNGKRADIFAYNESRLIIFEIKVSNGNVIDSTKGNKKKETTGLLPVVSFNSR